MLLYQPYVDKMYPGVIDAEHMFYEAAILLALLIIILLHDRLDVHILHLLLIQVARQEEVLVKALETGLRRLGINPKANK